jgi:hypothetical protein
MSDRDIKLTLVGFSMLAVAVVAAVHFILEALR